MTTDGFMADAVVVGLTRNANSPSKSVQNKQNRIQNYLGLPTDALFFLRFRGI